MGDKVGASSQPGLGRTAELDEVSKKLVTSVSRVRLPFTTKRVNL